MCGLTETDPVYIPHAFPREEQAAPAAAPARKAPPLAACVLAALLVGSCWAFPPVGGIACVLTFLGGYWVRGAEISGRKAGPGGAGEEPAGETE